MPTAWLAEAYRGISTRGRTWVKFTPNALLFPGGSGPERGVQASAGRDSSGAGTRRAGHDHHETGGIVIFLRHLVDLGESDRLDHRIAFFHIVGGKTLALELVQRARDL